MIGQATPGVTTWETYGGDMAGKGGFPAGVSKNSGGVVATVDKDPWKILERINGVTPATRYVCGSKAVITSDESEKHFFAKRIDCGKEWCPKCGENDSPAHMQRVSRWLPKVQQIESQGYIVIQFPKRFRMVVQIAYSKGALQSASSKIVDVLAGKRCGRRGRVGGFFKRGLLRWHFYGEGGVGGWNPHVNILVDGEYLEPERLAELRQALCQAFDMPDLIINYQYSDNPSQKYHQLKYVTRATFRNYYWSVYMAEQLYSFRNCRWWGSWKDEPVWQLTPEIEQQAGAVKMAGILATGFCPLCGEKLKPWHLIPSEYLEIWRARPIGNTGYYYVLVQKFNGITVTPLDVIHNRGDWHLDMLNKSKVYLANKYNRNDDSYWQSVFDNEGVYGEWSIDDWGEVSQIEIDLN